MTTIGEFINSNPVATHFFLTIAISWGGFVLVVGPGTLGKTKQFETLLPLALLARLVGSSTKGTLLTGFLGRRSTRVDAKAAEGKAFGRPFRLLRGIKPWRRCDTHLLRTSEDAT